MGGLYEWCFLDLAFSVDQKQLNISCVTLSKYYYILEYFEPIAPMYFVDSTFDRLKTKMIRNKPILQGLLLAQEAVTKSWQ